MDSFDKKIEDERERMQQIISEQSWLRMDEVIRRNVEFLYLNLFFGPEPLLTLIEDTQESRVYSLGAIVSFLVKSHRAKEAFDASSGAPQLIASKRFFRESDWLFDERLLDKRGAYIQALIRKGLVHLAKLAA